MNVRQNDQKQVTDRQKEARATTSVFELQKMGKPVGPVGDVLLRFRNGGLVTADTGGQN
jgi:hypothetical protein